MSYVPKHAQEIKDTTSTAVVYVHHTNTFNVIGFTGRRNTPNFNNKYASAAVGNEYIQLFFKKQQTTERLKQSQSQDNKTTIPVHDFVVGDSVQLGKTVYPIVKVTLKTFTIQYTNGETNRIRCNSVTYLGKNWIKIG